MIQRYQIWEAAVRLHRAAASCLPVPGAPIELMRCQSDGDLVTMKTLKAHVGHRVGQPVRLTWGEVVKIGLGIIPT